MSPLRSARGEAGNVISGVGGGRPGSRFVVVVVVGLEMGFRIRLSLALELEGRVVGCVILGLGVSMVGLAELVEVDRCLVVVDMDRRGVPGVQ